MRKYLIFDNIVRGAGIGHMLMCYNHAIQIAMDGDFELIVPRCIMGHKGLGKNFEFEDFFGLEKHPSEQIAKIKEQQNSFKYVEWVRNGCEQNFNFKNTKSFFKEKYLRTIDSKIRKYKSHAIPDKINISIHIRRGDIVSKQYFENYKKEDYRIFPDVWFRQSLDEVLKEKNYQPSDVHVHVYSEMQADGFYYNEKSEKFDLKKVFDFSNCTFHLSSDTYEDTTYEDVYNMITSDIFIGARSGLALIISLYRDWQDKESFIESVYAPVIKLNELNLIKVIVRPR